MPLDQTHPDYWTEALQFTQTLHRNVYPAIHPSNDKIRCIASGKVVLVTGAGSGFGKAACRQWARSGARGVVLVARSLENIESVSRLLALEAPSTETMVLSTDVLSPTQVRQAFQQLMGKFESIDVVVHCAGVLGPIEKLADADPGAWSEAFDINLKGTFNVIQALSQISQGKEVTFIHAGTAASYFASPGQSAYTTSKAACNMLLDQLHVEHSNIRVFNVHPGMAKSKVLRKELHVFAEDAPELFGSVSVYLSGPQADFLRGRFVAVNWDVDQLEAHSDAIVRDGLLQNQPMRGHFGPGGHQF